MKAKKLEGLSYTMRFRPETVVSVVRDVFQKSEVAPVVAEVPAVNQNPATPQAQQAVTTVVEKPQIVQEVIIEEISIDGMCGVY